MQADLDAYFLEHRQRHLEELIGFLRIPSISALPEHRGDIDRAAGWVATQLREAGVPRVETLPTDGHPLVFGEWHVSDDLPTILIYSHYDVKSADPLNLWLTPPFEPNVRDGRVYARGATDDKGLLLIPIKAVEAYHRLEGRPPLNIKFLSDGEEEIGSPSLPGFMSTHRELLSTDLAVKAQGGMWDHHTPSLTTRTRGTASLQIDVQGANSDLHSGMHGGAVQNPLHGLATILASLRDANGRIMVKGFYDRVQHVHPTERQAIREVPFDDEAYKRRLGVDEVFGEAGYTTLERQWIRPTLEVNGMWGGYQGDGPKTVIPNEAHAKVNCRLVPDQDPTEIISLVEAHVKVHCPPGVRVSVRRFRGGARPYVMPLDHPALTIASQVLNEIYGRKPLVTPVGGALPFANLVVTLLGVYLVYFGFGGRDNNIHAPNESFPLEAFDRGVRVYADYIRALSQAGQTVRTARP